MLRETSLARPVRDWPTTPAICSISDRVRLDSLLVGSAALTAFFCFGSQLPGHCV